MAVSLRTWCGAVKSNCFHAEGGDFRFFLGELLETEWMAFSEGLARVRNYLFSAAALPCHSSANVVD
jgi:hypothetical protein